MDIFIAVMNKVSIINKGVGIMRYPSKRLGGGFTLIELLVVIAIIAILSSILFPVFSKSRERAQQATCLSNLRQIGMVLLMYAQDYDGLFPAPRRSPNYPENWYDGPQRMMESYLDNKWSIANCPSANDSPGTSNPNDYDLLAGMSAAFYSNYIPRDVTNPSNWPLVGDYASPSGSTYKSNHKDGANWCLVDGHAKWYTIEQLKGSSTKVGKTHLFPVP